MLSSDYICDQVSAMSHLFSKGTADSLTKMRLSGCGQQYMLAVNCNAQ